ncbi:hypothetical protein D3C87_1232930 [compost metagenome]
MRALQGDRPLEVPDRLAMAIAVLVGQAAIVVDIRMLDAFAPRRRGLGVLEEGKDLGELGDRRVIAHGLQIGHSQAHVGAEKGNALVADRLLEKGDPALGMPFAGLLESPLEQLLGIRLEVRVGHNAQRQLIASGRVVAGRAQELVAIEVERFRQLEGQRTAGTLGGFSCRLLVGVRQLPEIGMRNSHQAGKRPVIQLLGLHRRYE